MTDTIPSKRDKRDRDDEQSPATPDPAPAGLPLPPTPPAALGLPPPEEMAKVHQLLVKAEFGRRKAELERLEAAASAAGPHPLLVSGAVRIKSLPPALVSSLSFEKAWNLHPSDRGNVCHGDAEVQAHRFYASFGNTPEREEASLTYMFSADGKPTPNIPLPTMFQPLMDYLNSERKSKLGTMDHHQLPDFNQVVINWYEGGSDYTPYHIDCLSGMAPDATVTTVSFVENQEGSDVDDGNTTEAFLRHLVFKPVKASPERPNLRIPTTHGLSVEFGGEALSKWRHGVPKAQCDYEKGGDSAKSNHRKKVLRRISLSFRSYA